MMISPEEERDYDRMWEAQPCYEYANYIEDENRPDPESATLRRKKRTSAHQTTPETSFLHVLGETTVKQDVHPAAAFFLEPSIPQMKLATTFFCSDATARHRHYDHYDDQNSSMSA